MKNGEGGAFSVGLILGYFLGALSILLVIPFAGSETVAKFVYDYQGLLGAVIALLGAFGAVWVVLKQIAHTEELAAQQRDDLRHAARTLMPSALTGVLLYSQDCMRLLKAFRPPRTADPFALIPVTPPLALLNLPVSPREAVLDLKDCVQSAPPVVRAAILDLVAALQIQNSRLRSMHTSLSEPPALPCYPLSPRQIDDRIYDALLVYARCETLYGFARGRTQEVRELDLRSAAFNNGFDDGDYPDLWGLLGLEPEPETDFSGDAFAQLDHGNTD